MEGIFSDFEIFMRRRKKASKDKETQGNTKEEGTNRNTSTKPIDHTKNYKVPTKQRDVDTKG